MRRLVESVRPKLPESPRVIEFGNQRFGAGKDFASTQAFYESLGFSYMALDVNTNMGAVVCDLNVVQDYFVPVDLVTNNGTGEHIFNQAAVFENAHRMTKAGGFMLHCLPCSPWINHGFYNYNPILFRDLAYANDYIPVMTAVSNRWGLEIIPLGAEGFIEKRPTELEGKIKRICSMGGDAFIISILKKAKDSAFRMPIQGKYEKDIADDELVKRYAS